MSAKFLAILKSLYKDTRAAIWTPEGNSEFKTESGLKQGCSLPGFLFALFLNDLYDSIGEGLRIGNLNIRVLLYADDVALLASEPKVFIITKYW